MRHSEDLSVGANLFGDSPTNTWRPGAEVPDLATMPLAARMRPRALDEFVGQESVVGLGTLLRRAIEEDRLTSAIFWGPPGCGKSTLAAVIAQTTHAAFENFSAVTS